MEDSSRGLIEALKDTVRIVSVAAEMRAKRLPNTSPQRHHSVTVFEQTRDLQLFIL
jgi:hypothetical protein